MKSLFFMVFSVSLMPAAIAQDGRNDIDRPSVADRYIGCYDGYCPCDTSDPDYGGMDEVICRQVRNGIRVDREIMIIAASARDARRQLRTFQW